MSVLDSRHVAGEMVDTYSVFVHVLVDVVVAPSTFIFSTYTHYFPSTAGSINEFNTHPIKR